MSRNLTPRKKLAVPPVKSACLAWYCSLFSLSSGTCALLTGCSRASRTRCDGGQTCHNVSSKRCKVARARAEPALPPFKCLVRDRECCYIPSKRGGSRKTRTPRADCDILSTERSLLSTSGSSASDGLSSGRCDCLEYC
jgi:hypothetical protein